MRKRRTCICFISMLLLSVLSFAQEPVTKGDTLGGTSTATVGKTRSGTSIALPEKQEAPVYKQRYGLRLGVDLSRPVRSFFQEDYYGLELVGDYRLSYKYFAAAEVGVERRTKDEDFFTYRTEGQFIRFGVDYNTYGNWYGMENLIYVGGRYGFSLFSQQLTNYVLHKDNQYWTENVQGADPAWLGTYSGRTAHWLELVLGIKAELLRGLYAGMSVRVGLKLTDNQSGGFPNFYIPGFGRVYEGSRFGTSFNYTLSYLIPLYKKAQPVKEDEAKTAPEKAKGIDDQLPKRHKRR